MLMPDDEDETQELTCDDCAVACSLNDGCLICPLKSEKDKIVYVKKNQTACEDFDLGTDDGDDGEEEDDGDG